MSEIESNASLVGAKRVGCRNGGIDRFRLAVVFSLFSKSTLSAMHYLGTGVCQQVGKLY